MDCQKVNVMPAPETWKSGGYRLLLILCMGMAFLLPRNIDYIKHGLDPSWIYGINIAGQLGWKFGTDIQFTHGPLGFLSSTCGVGHNIEIALLATGILLLSQLWLLGQTVFSRSTGRIGSGQLLFSGLLLWAMPRPFLASYLLYVVLLSLSVAWFHPKKRGYFLLACAFTTAQCFIKFPGALSCCSAIGLFWAIWFFKDRNAWRPIRWLPVFIPAAFVLGYLLYNPSWAGLWGYLRAAQELTDGHSASMSFVHEPLFVGPILTLGGIYAVLLICMAAYNRSMAQYFFMFFGCFGMAMKHGLVRADLWHFDEAVCDALPMFSLMLLFVKIERGFVLQRRKWLVMVAGLTLILLVFTVDIRGVVRRGRAYFHAVYGPNWNRISAILGVGDKMTNPLKGGDPLPQPFLDAMGTNSIAFYPLELSFAAYNAIHLSVMPVLQAYCAYTPYLDARNAAYFQKGARAPTFIVFGLRTIDGRWPLIESPMAWTAIYENYDIHICDEPYLLLKRRSVPRHIHYSILSAEERNPAQMIPLPADEGLIFISADMRLSLWGRIVKLFYNIPPVTMRAAFANGLVVEGRCIPENLGSKTLVSFLPLPFDLRQTADFIQTGHATNRVERIAFSGPGLAYYRKTMRVTLYEGQMVNADGTADEPAWREPEK